MTTQESNQEGVSREPSDTDAPATQPACIDSRALFGAAQELLIQHDTQTYRLRITSQGKLILTK